MNASPVLIPRTARSQASRRLPVPFDLHARIVETGYDFIDDIIWEKPFGAGCGRGRNFAVTRTPLAYKTVPVTEYIFVYRKRTDRLIDWNIRHDADPKRVALSRITDDYERTNVWRMNPARSPHHPAVFPDILAEKVIRYYSFVGDVVLDPFGGIGTTARAAHRLGRHFIYLERKREYFDYFLKTLPKWSHATPERLSRSGRG